MKATYVVLAALLTVAGCASAARGPSTGALSAVLLQVSDFPPTWTGYPDSSGVADVFALDDTFARCVGADLHQLGAAQRSVRSDVFRSGGDRIASSGTAFADNDAAPRRLGLLGYPEADACMAERVRAALPKALPGTDVTGVRLSLTAGAFNAPANVGGTLTGVVTVRQGGRPLALHVDASFVTGFDFYAAITFFGAGRPVDPSVRGVLVDDVSRRALKS